MSTLQRTVLIGAACLVLLLSACVGIDDGALHARLMLWHSDEATAPAIQEVIDDFEALNPGVHVVVQVIPKAELPGRYLAAAPLGLGPDLLVGSSQWISNFADIGIIRDIGAFNPQIDTYLTAALENVRYKEGLFGLPFSLETVALYYNTALVDNAPDTLDNLLAQAAAGRAAGIETQFNGAFWGVQALGGRLFDDEGRVVLDQGGLASWLNWLETANDAPGIVLSRDRSELLGLFLKGNIAYYTGRPDDAQAITEALGNDGFRVVPLPGGPGGPSGPLLNVNTIMFNTATSDAYAKAALALAAFMTNDVQSRELIRTGSFIPANRHVQPNSQLYPGTAGFLAQARTAVAIPNTTAMEQVMALGETLLQQVLSGMMSSTEAATTLSEQVNTSAGFETTEATAERCDLSDEVVVWHSLTERELSAMETIITRYSERCADVSINLVGLPSTTHVVQGFQAVAGTNAAPDALLVPSTEMMPLAADQLLQEVEANVTQRFVPAALSTLRFRNGLYGLPVALHVQVLYYNAATVTDPAVTLDGLQTAAQSGTGVALPIDFPTSYWGAPSFGATLFDEDGRLLLGDGGFSDWLTWMQHMAELPSVVTGGDQITRSAFARGDAAYYVGPSDNLPDLAAELGPDTVGMVMLPYGPAALSSPILTTTAYLISASEDENATAGALDFGLFLTDITSQTVLAEESWQAPANVNVSIEEFADLAVIVRQASQATVLPNIPEASALLIHGNSVVRRVVTEGRSSTEAVEAFVAEVNSANGFALPAPTPSPISKAADPELNDTSSFGEQ